MSVTRPTANGLLCYANVLIDIGDILISCHGGGWSDLSSYGYGPTWASGERVPRSEGPVKVHVFVIPVDKSPVMILLMRRKRAL